jgi:PAS domain S-box-containing protein
MAMTGDDASRPADTVRGVLLALGTAVTYFFAARLGLSLAFDVAQVTTVWPPTGIALATVLLCGPTWTWPGIALGAFAANLLANEPVLTAAGIATGNTLEAVVGATVLQRVGFRPSLARLRDVLALMVLGAGAATTISASVGALSLCLSGLQPWTAFGEIWWTWWVGDALGAMVVAPAIFVWVRPSPIAEPPGRRGEAALLVAVTLAVSLGLFSLAPDLLVARILPLEYTVFPLVVWAALRFGQRATASVTLLVAALAITSTVHGRGPFAMPTPGESLLGLQLFMGVVATTGLLLGAAITERDRLRQRGIRDLERLRESEERLRLALDAGRMGVWDWNIVTGKVRWSDNLESIHGLEPGSFSGTFEAFQAIIHPEDRERVQQAIDQAVESGTGYETEFRNLRADGSIGWMSAIGRVFHDRFGRSGRMIGVGMDVTERRRLADDLAARVRELALADRRKDEFLAMLAHELRNPLAPLRTALHLLRAERGEGDRFLTIAERQVDQLVRLVDDLLDVSRITQGKIALRREPVALDAVVARAVETVRGAMDERGHVFRLSLPAEPIQLSADPARLAQVLANLLDNATKHTPPGGSIWLTAERVGDEAVLRVRDTGAGLAPELLPNIFDLFVQGDRGLDRAHGGLGIGLTIVKRVVELHGGRVEARSAGAGQGSEFIVHLPTSEPAFGTVIEPRAPLTGHAGPTRLKVLVVEDNHDTAEVLATVVELWGHDVRTAFNAVAAIAAVEEWRPDVVLSDLGLPGMDGYELARRLRRQSPASGGAVLIALSGYGREEDKRAALDAGFDHHFVKPPDLDALAELLGRVSAGTGERPKRTVH